MLSAMSPHTGVFSSNSEHVGKGQVHKSSSDCMVVSWFPRVEITSQASFVTQLDNFLNRLTSRS